MLRVDRIELFEGPSASSVEDDIYGRKQLNVCVDPPVQTMSTATYVEAGRDVATLDRWHRFSVQREELRCSDQSASLS